MVCPHCGATTTAPKGRCTTCNGDVKGLTSSPMRGGVTAIDGASADGETCLDASPDPLRGTDLETATENRTHSPVDAAPTVLGGNLQTQVHLRTVSDPSPVSLGGGVLSPGEPFGVRYHIIRSLGAGGMGNVYQAWDEELGVAVAIKVIRPETIADPTAARDLERQFKRELVLARNVTHKNVVRIHDMGEIEGIKYITMSYVHGADLGSILQREGRLTVSRALQIARQVAAGLAAAHEAKIIHRDLKPANIMVDHDDQALIMDFGIARSITGIADGHVGGAVVGTLEYLAPEQAKGEAVDHRADIYSFGLILSDMLVGRRYAAGAESAIAELMIRIEQVPAPLRATDPDLPEALEQIVASCVNPDPAARYQRTSDLLADLERLGSDGRVRAGVTQLTGASPVVQRATPPRVLPGRLRLAIGLAAVAMITITLVLGAAAVRDRILSRRSEAVTTSASPLALAILPFRNASGDGAIDWLGPSIPEAVRTEIGQSPSLRTVPPDRLRQILSDLKVAPDAILDPRTLGRLAEFASADVVLWGQYLKFGSEIRIDATLQDVKQQRAVQIQARVPNENDFLKAIAQLAEGVRGNLTVSAAALKELRATSFKPSTGSVQALRYYSEGLDLKRQGRRQEATKKFEASVQADDRFALAYTRLAQIYSELNEPSEAERFSRLAVSLSGSLAPQEKYLIEANHARILKDYAKAIEAYESLASILPDSDDVLFDLARQYEDTGAFDKARDRYARLLARDPKRLEALIAAARIENRLGKPEASLEYLDKALAIAVELNNVEQEAVIRRVMGTPYQAMNRPQESLRHYLRALEIERQLGRKSGIAAALSSAAGAYALMGQPDLAFKTYQESLQIRREIGDTRGIATSLFALGYLREQRGQYDGALALYRESLQLYRQLGSTAEEALALNNIGNMYLAQGRFEEARTYFERALTLHETVKAPGPKADTLHNLAITSTNAGDFDGAARYYLGALEIRRAAGDKRKAAIESFSMGTLFQLQGRYGAALQSHEEAVKTLRELREGGFWMSPVLAQYGSALNEVGRAAAAESVLNEALTLARQLKHQGFIAQTLMFQGDGFFYRGDFSRARALYEESLKVASTASDRRLVFLIRLSLAKVETKSGRSRAAVPVLQGLSADADKLGLRHAFVDCSVYLGQALANIGAYARARQTLETAAGLSERMGLRTLLALSQQALSATAAKAGHALDAQRFGEAARRAIDEIRREAKSDDVLKRVDLTAAEIPPAHRRSDAQPRIEPGR